MDLSDNKDVKEFLQSKAKRPVAKSNIQKKISQVKKCRFCEKETGLDKYCCSDCDYRMACGLGCR